VRMREQRGRESTRHPELPVEPGTRENRGFSTTGERDINYGIQLKGE
jgi:hypothetical protein